MQIDDAKTCALFLDIDGTLIDIAATPESIVVPGDLVPLLERLSRGLDGALAIITGRPVSDVDRMLAPLKLAAAGVHGAEMRMTAGGETISTVPLLVDSTTEAIHRLDSLAPGVMVEPKRYSIAVHYRNAPAAEPLIEAELNRILERSPEHLILCRGRRVFEVVPKAISKGSALETFLKLPQFRHRRPIMVGDDVSDETAFAAAVRCDGLALRVAGEHFPHETAELDGPTAVRAWLSTLAGLLKV